MLTPEKLLLTLFALMFAVGAADYLCNSPFKLGKRFLESTPFVALSLICTKPLGTSLVFGSIMNFGTSG